MVVYESLTTLHGIKSYYQSKDVASLSILMAFWTIQTVLSHSRHSTRVCQSVYNQLELVCSRVW